MDDMADKDGRVEGEEGSAAAGTAETRHDGFSMGDDPSADLAKAQSAPTLPPDMPPTAPQEGALLRASPGLRVPDMETIVPRGDKPPSSRPDSGVEGDAGDDLNDFVVGCREDKYRLGKVLGRGGMGVVCRTRDTQLQRNVALKMLTEQSQRVAGLPALLVREARLTGQLEHPNIVPVYDLGVFPDGRIFYSMRLYRGETLATIIGDLDNGDRETRRRYDEESLLQVLRQTCMAVAYAHSRGVVHRDIKPGNVLVGDYGEVQLTDWGVAQVTEGATVLVPPLTTSGNGVGAADGTRREIVGTPQYMAPEQVLAPSEVDPRSDIYSLGVMLYEMLTLRSPYEKLDDVDTIVSQVVEARVLPAATRNSARAVPRELAEIAHRALAHRPEDRFQTVRELWRAVDEYLQGALRRKRLAERARLEVERGKEAAAQYYRIQEERLLLGRRIATLQSRLKGWHPLSEKRRIWDLRDQRDRLEIALAKAFSEAIDYFSRAIVHEPQNRAAGTALARLYWSKLGPAVEDSDFENTVYFGDLVRRLSEPRVGPLRAGGGALSVRTLPEGALVWLHGIATLDPEASAERGEPIGTAPLMDLPVASGVYIAVARADGYREARTPVLMQAGESHQILLNLAPLHEDRPMVGRDGELGRLKALYESAAHNPRAVFTLLSSPPGMGSTKLLEAFDDALARLPETIFLCYTEPRRTHPHLPFAPFADMLAFRAGIKAEDDSALRERKLVEMVRLVFTQNNTLPITGRLRLLIEETAADLALLPGLLVRAGNPDTACCACPSGGPDYTDPAQTRRRIMSGVCSFFEALSSWRTVYLRIVPATHLDPSSLELLALLKRRLAGSPLLALAVSREQNPDGALAQVFDNPVRLAPLDELAVERFVANYLDGSVSRRMVASLLKQSRGRPDHLDVLLPLLASNGEIEKGEDGWDIKTQGSRALDYESALAAFVLRPLTEPQLRLLRKAAVAGKVFAREELVALGEDEPEKLAAELVEKQVVRHRPTAGILWREIYAFSSDRLHEIAYQDSPPHERRRLHGLLAAHMAEMSAPPAEAVALMAGHYRRAGLFDEAANAYECLAAHARLFGAIEEERACRRMASE